MQDPNGVMVWLAENIQACLRDFQTGTASMDRQRHLASIARGLLCFCLTTNIHEQLRPIRPIRGNKTSHRTGTLHQAKDIVVAPGEPIFYCQRQLFFSGGLEGPARQDWELRHGAAAKTRLEQRPMAEGPRRYAS